MRVWCVAVCVCGGRGTLFAWVARPLLAYLSCPALIRSCALVVTLAHSVHLHLKHVLVLLTQSVAMHVAAGPGMSLRYRYSVYQQRKATRTLTLLGVLPKGSPFNPHSAMFRRPPAGRG